MKLKTLAVKAPLVLAVSIVAVASPAPFAAPRPPDIPFRIQMLDGGASETAAVADVNKDGRLDIVSGEHWYQSPAWTKHKFRELDFSNNYVDGFSDLPVDVDGDGYPDIASVTWFAKKVSWFRNPGKGGGAWVEAPINAGFNIEFATLADIDNDGKANEIVAQENGTGQSWYEVNKSRGSGLVARDSGLGSQGLKTPSPEPRIPSPDFWIKHVVSDRSYGHGIGFGDVNKDGRNDILTPRGWLEAPADPRAAGNWTYHPAWESANVPVTAREAPAGAAAPPDPAAPPRVAELGFMHVLDVNGDGRNDVITAAGHDFGVFWFEQGADGKWTKRVIDSAWSQGHASTLVDINGDGRLDFVTGKRFMAHNGSDPGEREPLGVYWYEYRPVAAPAGGGRGAAGPQVEWIRHLIDYGGRMGGGMQIPVVDLDGDGDLDVVCAGKSGLFLVENLTKGPGSTKPSAAGR
jgi:FG-GAP-like repeat